MPIDHEKMMGAGLEHARKKREAGKESPGGKESKEKKEKRTNREVLTRAVEKLERCIETFPKDSPERKRAEHTLASVRYAIKYEGKKGAPKGKNAVEVRGYDNRVAYIQYEGVPVDEIINTLKQRSENIRKETTALKVAELKKKLAELEYQYEQEPTLYNKLEVYKQIDVVKRDYEQTKKELDGGFPTAKELDAIGKELEDRSKTYFEEHYTKEHGEDEGMWLQDEKDKQDLRTRHEAHLIAKDYRSTGSEEGDYKAAMEVMKYRRELDLAEPEEEEEKAPEETPVPSPELAPETAPAPEPKPAPEFQTPEVKLTNYRVNISELAQRMAKVLTDARLDEHYAHSNWFKRKTRALTENRVRLELYDAALKEIMQDQDLLKAMEARSLADQHLVGQQADKRGFFKKTLHIGSKEAAKKIATAREGVADKRSPEEKLKDYYQLIDSVFEEYEKEVVDDKSELGDLLGATGDLQTKTEEMCQMHLEGKFNDRKDLEAWAKQNLEPLAKLASKDKAFSQDKEKQAKAGELLFASNWWKMAEDYKGHVNEQVDVYVAKCKAEGKEVKKEDVLKHAKGRLALKMRLGLKDRDLANNKPEEFLQEYEKYKGGKGVYKLLHKGGAWKYVGGVLAASYGSGFVTRATVNVLSKRTFYWAGAVAGVGAFASFGVPIGVGIGLGAYYGWKRRKQQVEADIRHAQRYEALGGTLSSVLDAKKGLRAEGKQMGEGQMGADIAIAELKARLSKTNLDDADKQLLAGIFARMDIKKDKIADLIKADDETGKRFASTQTVDSQLKILRKDLETKFGLTGADWQKLVGDARKFLEDDVKNAEANIKKYEKWEAGKAAVVGGIAGGVGALIGQKLAYAGTEWLTRRLGFHRVADYFASRGTAFDYFKNYFQGHKDPNLALFPLEQAPGTTSTIPGTPGGHKSFAKWMSEMKIKTIHGTAIAEAHTKGWFENTTPMQTDPVTGKLMGAELNELRFHIIKDAGGMKLKAPLLQYGSWHGPEPELVAGGNPANPMDYRVPAAGGGVAPGGSERVWPDTHKLLDEGKLKFVLIPKPGAEAVYLDIDKTTGEAVVPTEYQNLFDARTGKCLADTYGTAKVEAVTDKTGAVLLDSASGKPKGYNLWWLNSDRNRNAEIDFGTKPATAGQTIVKEGYGYEMAPGTPLWRRKIYNKPKKEGRGNRAEDQQRMPETQVAAGSEPTHGVSKEPARGPESGGIVEKLKLTPEIVEAETRGLVAFANNPDHTDDQILAAVRNVYNLEQRYELGDGIDVDGIFGQVLKAAPPLAWKRIAIALNLLDQEEIAGSTIGHTSGASVSGGGAGGRGSIEDDRAVVKPEPVRSPRLAGVRGALKKAATTAASVLSRKAETPSGKEERPSKPEAGVSAEEKRARELGSLANRAGYGDIDIKTYLRDNNEGIRVVKRVVGDLTKTVGLSEKSVGAFVAMAVHDASANKKGRYLEILLNNALYLQENPMKVGVIKDYLQRLQSKDGGGYKINVTAGGERAIQFTDKIVDRGKGPKLKVATVNIDFTRPISEIEAAITKT